ncbi:RluA family pseudouridine synthase [Sporosarcina pasteurii]|uniref:Pseudouridine synthase n=1 Tax=Sporosarcina pasteurii TaxID=1474 RepID=A0A380CCG9_SPOPA|nr:RluA family pseudouridine synthase [Sporosarcina pasteurii]MDS9472644.1 RluA family pseudouridine synthase [Sporosarcina pasteurii]QBQ04305.1 RluA family pseudouridine synthase [Sporosarcina pasteurii]SUJ16566.1 Ribosomal large subunit pseudouridine synthase D [Sporosarcina pasteurii]
MSSFHYQISDDGITVEQLLREEWQAGKKTVHLMRMEKSVVDMKGTPIDWRTPLKAGTTIQFTVPDARSNYLSNEQVPLKILFEDEHIIAVWKPAGMATHPTKETENDTLMNVVFAYISKNGGQYAEHIHRLDKGTAGVLLIAKHPIAKTIFDRMIENNEITRTYEAELDGTLKRPRGTINRPIGKDRHHSARRRVSPTGQQAITHFKVLERKAQTTIVEAKLETGRTHQIRVHFAHLGHPVTGDTLYEGSETEDGNFHLTATALSFIHPFTKEQITVQ